MRAGPIAALGGVCLALAVGCESGPIAGTNTRGAVRGDPPPAIVLAPVAPPPATTRRGARGGASPSPATPAAAPVAIGGAGGAEGASRPVDPNEELSRALASAFGTPTDCISDASRDRLRGTLSINVNVRVLGSGRVLNATVSALGLLPEDTECMRRRAENLRLPGPVEGAPRSVSTTVRYEIQDTRVTTTERSVVPVAPQPGRVAADSTLPAANTETGRPAGSVAPSSTLPALAEPGPAPGAVPPAHTLPAIAE
ncbi:MAG: hypothetical protein AB7S26_15150 [Sandaracinaceae bacterium]